MTEQEKAVRIAALTYPDGTTGFFGAYDRIEIQEAVAAWKNALSAEENQRYREAGVTFVVGHLYVLPETAAKLVGGAQ